MVSLKKTIHRTSISSVRQVQPGNTTRFCVLTLAILSLAACSQSPQTSGTPRPPAEDSIPAEGFQGTADAEAAGSRSARRGTAPSGNSASNAPGGVYFVDPDQYSLQRAAFSKDVSGNIRLNTVLLPAEKPDVAAQSDSTAGGYLGPTVCGECHATKLADFMQTPHYRTSAVASKQTILGSFAAGENRLETGSPKLSFEMFESAEGSFQRLLLFAGDDELGADFPFDIVTGSGKVAQTYLYWKGERLYQLHATYLTSGNRWVNSPGFDDGVANFARPIHAVCMECHSTFFQPVEETTNQFKRDNFILGVTCERCHGPATEHVAFHREHSDAVEAHSIVNPSKLSVQRSLEVCQVCHGGLPTGLKRSPLSFRPGESLDDFYDYPTGNDGSIGIHTNSQLPRLRQSRCFQASASMTCSDCHNPHSFERGNTQLFSDRCITCHRVQTCGKFEELGAQLSENCIDCHMPRIEMDDITFHSPGARLSPTMRDHFIAVWPQATADFLDQPEMLEGVPSDGSGTVQN